MGLILEFFYRSCMQICIGYNVWEQIIKFENNIGEGVKFIILNLCYAIKILKSRNQYSLL